MVFTIKYAADLPQPRNESMKFMNMLCTVIHIDDRSTYIAAVLSALPLASFVPVLFQATLCTYTPCVLQYLEYTGKLHP